MRRPFRRTMINHRHFRRGFRRPIRRAGGLLGLVGVAALGYTLLEKHQREQVRNANDQTIVWDEGSEFPDPS